MQAQEVEYGHLLLTNLLDLPHPLLQLPFVPFLPALCALRPLLQQAVPFPHTLFKLLHNPFP